MANALRSDIVLGIVRFLGPLLKLRYFCGHDICEHVMVGMKVLMEGMQALPKECSPDRK